MSLPSFPNIDPPIKREDAVNQILSSIAMEELGMSHILNAEGEKLQYILGTLPGLSGPAATVKDVLNANESVKDLLETTTQNQLLLRSKMQCALDTTPAQGPAGLTGPTGPTGTFLIGKHIKLQKTSQYDNKIYHITWNTALWRLWVVFSYTINDKKEVSKWKKIKPSSPLTKDSPRSQTPEYRSKSNWMLLALKHWIPLCRNALPEM